MTTTTYGIDYYYMDPNGCLVYYETSPNCVVIPPPPPPPPPPSGITTQPTLYNGLLSFLSAVPLNYQQVLVSWKEPQASYLDWRLLRSRYGFPVDQNDGVVIMDTDSSTFPGFSFLDNDVIPGTYNYYAIYLLVAADWPTWSSATTYAQGATVVYGSYVYQSLITSNLNNTPPSTATSNTDWGYVGLSEVWYRSGFAACLSPWDFESASWLKGRIPNYFLNLPNQELTTSDPIGNTTLNGFLNVIGWGIDYMKTTGFVAENVNNPAVIPENWLYNLADQLGLPFEPEISTGVLRGAVANQATLIQQRGTLEGIEAYITALTGWSADIRPGTNQMLEDDQAHFIDPQVSAWSAGTNYAVGELVTYNNYVFSSVINANLNNTPPTGTPPVTNGNWAVLYYSSNPTLLENSITGWINTWEPRKSGVTNEVAPTGSLAEAVGIQNRTSSTSYLKNGLLLTNPSGATATMDLQSISRTTADITAGNAYANRTQVIGDGLPVPYTIPQQTWSSTVQYPSGTVVTYNGQPFVALKSSMNIPPTAGTQTLEWQPVGFDSRIALMMSAYASQNLSTGTNEQLSIQPYAAWYDQWGNNITTVYPRCVANQYVVMTVATAAALPSLTATSTTLTATANGVLTVDGVALTVNQTVLVTDQATQTQNGYYKLTTAGTGSVPFVLTRLSAPTAAQMPYSYASVTSGTANIGTTWFCQNTTTPTFGTTNITFSTTPLSAGYYPANLVFQSFASGWGSSLASTTPEVGGSTYPWTADTSTFTVNGYEGGCIYPSSTTRTIAYVNYPNATSLQLGLTFLTLPTGVFSTYSAGLLVRWTADNSYFRIDQTAITKNNAGTKSYINHSTAFADGDRMLVTLNGNTITVYRYNAPTASSPVNLAQVSQDTSGYNATATHHGVIVETT